MPYLLAIVLVAVAAVFFIFLGVWGGILWIVFAAAVLGALFVTRGRQVKVDRARTGPTGTTRASPGGAETANERVGT
jgi:UPF0716 family protein affecting phage T7 exclusion